MPEPKTLDLFKNGLPPLKREGMPYSAKEIIAYIEQEYYTGSTGKIPTQEEIAKALDLPIEKVRDAWSLQEFKDTLVDRGLEYVEGRDGILSPTQIMFANALLNANDKRSVRQLLELFKIKSPQYNAWLRDSAFQSYLRTRAEQIFESSDYEAYKALVRAVSNGDVNAIKFFFELRGIYNPKLTVNINIRSVMTEVIRVITDNVKDPQVIEVIATELEKISDAS